MSNLMQIVENEQTSEFYPTPESLVSKMLEGIEWGYIDTILEPSAGKGDILREIAIHKYDRYYRSKNLDIDCIEIDANLRQILKYNFSDERKSGIHRRQSEIKDGRKYNYDRREYEDLSPELEAELEHLNNEEEAFFSNGIHIIHDDFLTYNPFKQYDLIIMNPPFSNGDKHLLKALEIQRKGGSIICLLNAETIRNPYTETRKALIKKLNEYNAQIEYIENAFVSAERKTGVEIALIKVFIEHAQEESDIYNRLKEAEHLEDIDVNTTDLEVTDFIKAIIRADSFA